MDQTCLRLSAIDRVGRENRHDALCHFQRNGAVAQLGERQNRTLEAGGSIPLCSTNKPEGLDIVRCLTPSSFWHFLTVFFTMVLRTLENPFAKTARTNANLRSAPFV